MLFAAFVAVGLIGFIVGFSYRKSIVRYLLNVAKEEKFYE